MDRGNKVRPLAISLTVLGAILRLIPHPPNFAPVGGMSLYAGARLRGWQAFALPLAADGGHRSAHGRILGRDPLDLFQLPD